jgi:hypothetical protein
VVSEGLKAEMQVFLASLHKWGYTEGADWTWDTNVVKFHTLSDTLAVFSKQ